MNILDVGVYMERLFGDAEGEDGGEIILLAGVQYAVGEVGLVDGIGSVLGLQAEALILEILLAALAGIDAFQHVACIELNGGHIGEYVHYAAGLGRGDGSGEAQTFVVQVPVMVIALAENDLLVIAGICIADALCVAQIEGSAGNITHFAGGDAACINNGEGVGIDLHGVIQNGLAACLACQVEVAVVGQVAQGVLIGDGLVADHQLVVIGEGVGHHNVQLAGVVFLAVFGNELHDQHILADALDGGDVPQLFVEADVAAVQVGGAVFVLCQLVVNAVQGELAFADAVADAADERADVAAAGDVAVYIVVAQYNVGDVAVLVGHIDSLDDSAVVGDLNGCAGIVGQYIQVGLSAAGQLSKGLLNYAHEGYRLSIDDCSVCASTQLNAHLYL